MASIDLKDAYYLVPVHEWSRKYLRFRFNKELFEFTCLPFGINVAPYFFTKIMKPVFSYLRTIGYLSVIYLDDTLLISKSFKKCSENMKITKGLLEKLGFIINFDKSKLTPDANS